MIHIEHDAKGLVNAVVYADAAGKLKRQSARAVCVAGNAIETPRLLLNSSSSRFPQGLANGAGMVGKHYMRHMTGSVFAEFKDPIHHAFTQGEALYKAVGALKTHRVPPYPSTHNLGTCRMSEKPEDGVCNSHGQCHEVANLFISDGSQFTTSAAENPTLTIVTLAIRQADYIADALKSKSI